MTIRFIDHAQLSFPSGKEGELRDFYGRLIGLGEVGTPGKGPLRFRAGAQRIDLLPTENWVPAPATAHLAFEVHDLASLRRKLLAAGFELDESRPLPGHRRFYVNDPAGNALEFLEPEVANDASGS
jgi:catechol 2,3-dioxygenase-like lactoylglutathione lyase family enzyme